MPRGLWSKIPDRLRYVDKRVCPSMPKLEFALELDYKSEEKSYSGQKDAVRSMLAEEQGMIIRPPGCLAGDTIVEVAHSRRGSQEIKIADLYSLLHEALPYETPRTNKRYRGAVWAKDKKKWRAEAGHKGKYHFIGYFATEDQAGTAVAEYKKANRIGRTWSGAVKIRARYADGTIRLADVADVVKSGVKETYTLTTEVGHKIRATRDHRFLTVEGWKTLKEIAAGDWIFVDGGKSEKRGRKPHVYRDEISGLWNHPHARSKGRLCFSRLIFEAHMNGLGVNEWIEIIRRGQNLDQYEFLSLDLNVHHKDGNCDNNKISNLEATSHREHSYLHGKAQAWKHVTATTVLVKVQSIEFYGREPTYDICLADEPHNFLANGIVVHNSGKSNIALAFIASVGTRSLVIVHTEDILKQWVGYAQKAIPGIDIGIFRAQQREVKHLTIATVQTLYSVSPPKEWWGQFGCVILDEAAHGAAYTFYYVVSHSPAKYRFGLTASKTRADQMHPLNQILFGPIIHEQKMETKYPVEVRKIESDFRFNLIGGNEMKAKREWQRLVKKLVEYEPRNRKIAEAADFEIGQGRSVLILSRRIDHLENVRALMKNDAPILAAKIMSKRERQETISQFRDGKIRCVLATQLADEAVDFPALDCVMLIFPSKHKDALLQRVGRALRESAGKTNVVVYDCCDNQCRTLRNHWFERRKFYMEHGFTISKNGGQLSLLDADTWMSRVRKVVAFRR